MKSNQKTKIWAVVFLVFGFYFLASTPASAHTFATDGDITVLMHSNPDDDPIVSQPAAVLFQITDAANKFREDNCDCTLTIARANNVLFNGPLLHVVGASVYGFTAPFTFPVKAVYQITLTGKPKTGASFQNFQVEFDLRVDRGLAAASATDTDKKYVWVVAIALAFALMVLLAIYFIRHKRKSS